jgi:hypothetical protein
MLTRRRVFGVMVRLNPPVQAWNLVLDLAARPFFRPTSLPVADGIPIVPSLYVYGYRELTRVAA